jgi:ribonucleoside-diphosphate reductase alpha chain
MTDNVIDFGRRRLPNRRPSEIIAFSHDGHPYSGSVSRFDDGTVAEVFIDAQKISTQMGAQARDAAIAASLALQHGCPASALREALERNPDGTAVSPLTHFLDIVSGDQ